MFGEYYWVTADYNGATLILGAFEDEQQAYEEGYRKLPSINFTVIKLDTRDRMAARDKIKAMRLGNMNIDSAMQRARYKISEPEE